MSVREANLAKSARRCLKCGKVMWTDRCHRLCVACGHSNEALLEERVSVTRDVLRWLRASIYTEAS